MKTNTDLGILIMRVVSGLFFVAFGAMKFAGLQGFADAYLGGSLILALLVALGELAGGLALLTGYFFKPGALLLAVIMFGAMVLAHPIWSEAEMMNGLVRMVMVSLYVGLALTGPGKMWVMSK